MIDDASVCLTSREECVGNYDELVDRVTTLFKGADCFFDLVEPLVMGGSWEFDGSPSRPFTSAIPRHAHAHL